MELKCLKDGFLLNNQVSVPCIGFGTWLLPDGDVVSDSVRTAIEEGYRHIDTAAAYDNERGVGKGIKNSGIDRKDLFVTSKLWNDERGYKKTLAAFDKTLSDLQMDYLDLYLIHWPASSHRFENWEELNMGTWEAMIELYHKGYIRAIGVSNFLPAHLDALMKSDVAPMVNQLEIHPGYTQSETVSYCREHNIQLEAWSPLGSGRVLQEPKLIEIAERYGKSVAQLCIRWALQNGIVPLPKSTKRENIKLNADVFDFSISQEDMDYISNMDSFGYSGLHPDQVDF